MVFRWDFTCGLSGWWWEELRLLGLLEWNEYILHVSRMWIWGSQKWNVMDWIVFPQNSMLRPELPARDQCPWKKDASELHSPLHLCATWGLIWRWASVSQRGGPHQTQPCWCPYCGLPPPELWENKVLLLSHQPMAFCYGSSSWTGWHGPVGIWTDSAEALQRGLRGRSTTGEEPGKTGNHDEVSVLVRRTGRGESSGQGDCFKGRSQKKAYDVFENQ